MPTLITAEEAKTTLIHSLQRVIADPKSRVLDRTRAADCLGRLTDFSWFARPSDPLSAEPAIDNATAKRIADLCERLLLSEITEGGND